MSNGQPWQYGILEWIWDQGEIRITLPNAEEVFLSGSYAEVARALTELGKQGWEVATNSGTANWLLWTLKRSAR